MGVITCHAKGSFGFLQGTIFVKMSCSNHINMFCTHFQSFTCYYTSFIIILTKSTFGVTLVVSCNKGCCIKWSIFSYVLDDLSCIISVQVCGHNQILSLFTSVPLIPDLAKFQRIPSNLASSNLPKLCTLHLQPSRFFLSYYNYTMRRNPNIPWHSKLRSGYLQLPSLIWISLPSRISLISPPGHSAAQLLYT